MFKTLLTVAALGAVEAVRLNEMPAGEAAEMMPTYEDLVAKFNEMLAECNEDQDCLDGLNAMADEITDKCGEDVECIIAEAEAYHCSEGEGEGKGPDMMEMIPEEIAHLIPDECADEACVHEALKAWAEGECEGNEDCMDEMKAWFEDMKDSMHGGDAGNHGGDDGNHGGDDGNHGGDDGNHGDADGNHGGDDGNHGGEEQDGKPKDGGEMPTFDELLEAFEGMVADTCGEKQECIAKWNAKKDAVLDKCGEDVKCILKAAKKYMGGDGERPAEKWMVNKVDTPNMVNEPDMGEDDKLWSDN